MLFTALITTYNSEEFLMKAVESVNSQTCRDFELLVVDNGSTDGSVELLKEKYPEVESIFLSENTGFAPAVNRGLEQTKTPYALLLNNDILVEADFVQKMEQAMESHKNCFSVSAKMLQMHQPELLDGAGDL